LILDCQKEKKKESLLLFKYCVSNNMNGHSASKKKGERERERENTLTTACLNTQSSQYFMNQSLNYLNIMKHIYMTH
jgi:hypothetical protein